MIENISNYVPAKDVWDIVNNVYQKSLRNSDELFWQSIFNCLILILKKNNTKSFTENCIRLKDLVSEKNLINYT